MKEKMEKAEIEIICFEDGDDIVTASVTGVGGAGPTFEEDEESDL